MATAAVFCMGAFWGAFAAPTAGATARALSDGAEVARAATAQTVDVLVLDRVDVPLWELYPETYGDITRVTLAEGVTEIPDNFFVDCASLVSVTIPTSVTSIGDYAFSGCCGLMSVTIPSSVMRIGAFAFSGCADALFDVTTIPGARLVDGWVVGWNESGAANLDLSGARGLADGVGFGECEGLVSVRLPAGMTCIGDYLFSGCSGLTSVTIPDGVTRVGDWAFEDCASLTSIAIPTSVTSVGCGVFDGCCDALFDTTSIPGARLVDGWVVGWTEGGTANLDLSGVRGLVNGVGFGECEGLVSVRLPVGMTRIGDGLFFGCSGLTSVVIPKGVARIGDYAFSGCSRLTSVAIPDGVTRIGEWAFEGCASLGSIAIPTSVTNVGYGAFSECADALFDVMTIPGARLVDGWVVGWVEGGAANLDLSGARGLANGAFSWCEELVSVKLPAKIASIENEMFAGCSGLTSVTIPAGVTRIGDSAFSDCCGLTSLTIPDSVTSIGSSAFSCCCGLTSVSIPAGVTSIGYDAFSGCAFAGRVELDCDLARLCTPDGEAVTRFRGLGFYRNEEIVLGAGVTAVPDGFFEDCTGVRCVELRSWNLVKTTTLKDLFPDAYAELTGIVLPEAASFPDGFFGGFCDGCEELVRVNGKDWKTFGAQMGKRGFWVENGRLLAYVGTAPAAVTIPNGVTRIERSAFEGQTSMTSVVIPVSVTGIGKFAFANCSALTSVAIPAGVTDIGEWAFSECSGLTSVAIPAGVTSIGKFAFRFCSGLTSVTLPNGLTRIEEGTFVGCSALMSVMIPNGVTDIGRYAFSLCSNLTTVTIPDSVTYIGNHAFNECSGLMAVTIPGRVTNIGSSAFRNCVSLRSVTIPSGVTSNLDSAFFGCTGMMSFTVAEDNPYYSSANGLLLSKDGRTLLSSVNGNVTIPVGVTVVGDHAFSGRNELVSMTIPASVTSIGDSAFSGCSGLTSVTIPSSVTRIGASAFSGCAGALFDTTTIPGVRLVDGWVVGWDEGIAANLDLSGVRGLADGAFRGCEELVSVKLPAGMTSIGSSAFKGCSGLTSVTIPDSVTRIGDSAFEGCSGLTAVTIPSSVTEIGHDAFWGCDSVGRVELDCDLMCLFTPDGEAVECLGNLGFCESVEEVVLGATDVPDGFFEGFTGVRRVEFREGCPVVWWTTLKDLFPDAYAALTDVVLPEDAFLPDGFFDGCVALMPSERMDWRAIGERMGKQGLWVENGWALAYIGTAPAEVAIPDGVTGIGCSAFAGQAALTAVSIPSSVTRIGTSAFFGCGGLASVSISARVTAIGGGAFSGCGSLTSLVVAADNPNYTSTNGNLLTKDGRTLLRGVKGANGRGTIPAGVTEIGDEAFAGYGGLTAVTIPAGVTRIGMGAFRECIALKSVTIPAGVTEIGDIAFCDCCSLKSVTIPGSVTRIGVGAFLACSGLQSVTIPAGVTEIGDGAFCDCNSLQSVTIPASVTRIGYGAFAWCDELASFAVAAGNPNYTSVNGLLLTKDGRTLLRGVEGRVTIPSGVTEIGDEAFNGLRGLTSVTIPASVTRIGESAFCGCASLKAVAIPSGVTEIGERAFEDCSGLQSVTIPAGVTRIGDEAFECCTSLKAVAIPSGVTEIGAGAFCECSSLTSVTIPYGVTAIGDEAFSDCVGLQSVTIPASVTRIGDEAFFNCRSLTSVTIPAGVTEIGDSAFGWCSSLASFAVAADNPNYTSANGLLLTKDGQTLLQGVNGRVTIPAGVTEIRGSAFAGLSGLTSFAVAADNPNYTSANGLLLTKDGRTLVAGVNGRVAIPAGVTAIGGGAFEGRRGLTSVTIPESVTEIGWGAFSRCSGLTSVTIPAGVTEIGWGAFQRCSSLMSFAVAADNPSYRSMNGLLLTKDGRTLLAGVNGRVTIPAGVTAIGDSVFAECRGLTSVTIPETVTEIGDMAFHRCSSLTSVTIPDSVTRIGRGAFRDSSLTSVTIPGGVTEVGEEAFADCGLTSMTILAGVTAIDIAALKDCHWLRTLKIPTGLAVSNRNGVSFDGDNNGADHVYSLDTFRGVTVIVDGSEDSGEEPDASYGPFVPGAQVSIDLPDLVGYAAKGLPAGLRFDAKTGRITGAATKGGATATVTFTKRGAPTYTARLVVGPFPRLTVEVNDAAGGRVAGAGAYAAGKKVTLRATASKGCVFAGWYVDADFETPLAGDVDYRTPTLPYVTGTSDASLYAKFVAAEDDAAALVVPPAADEYAPNAAIEPIVLDVSGCVSLPKVTAKGLPPGLKLTAKALDVKATKTAPAAHYAANTVYGTPTKSGVYAATFAVTTAGKKTAAETVTFVVVDRAKGERVLKVVADAARGRAAGAGVYAAGRKAALKATAAKGFVFAGWYADAAFTTPLAGDVDFRTPSLPYVVGDGDETVHARFVPASEDGEVGLFVDGQWATDDAADTVFNTSGELSLALEVESASLPKVALTGLPAGLRFAAKAVFDRAGNVLAEANTVYGTATKPGVYAVTAKIANATVKRAVERRFTVVVDNLTGANGLLLVTDADGGEAGLRNGRGEKYAVRAGVAEHGLPAIAARDAADKVTLSGLPAGLKYDAKTGKVAGVATKAGVYTVTATVRSGRDAFVSTFTVEVAPLPAWAAGTFGGEVDRPNADAEDEDDEWWKYGTVTLTVSSAGKVTAKVLAGGKAWSFSANGFAAHDAARDAYRFRMETRAGDVLEGEILRAYHDVAALMGEWQRDGGIDPEGTFAPAGREPYHLIIWRNENGRDGRLDADATGRARKALDAVKAAGRFALADVDPKWGTVAVTVDARGNVKASGTTADGVKVLASGGFLTLDDADPYMCASLVFYDRKTGLVYDCSPSWQPLFDAEGNLAGSAEDWVVPIHCDPYPFE